LRRYIDKHDNGAAFANYWTASASMSCGTGSAVVA
jgi:hypothetical protein